MGLGLIGGMLVGYLIGSLPFGFWIARARGTDIQKAGSGNIGATNVLRVLGPRAAIPVLFLDVGKGFLAAAAGSFLAVRYGGNPDLGPILAGLAALAGHSWSFILGFTGGKGVATGAGVALYVMPVAVAVGAAMALAVIAVTRYVSLGSLLGSAAVVTFVLFGDYPVHEQAFAGLATAIIYYRHRSNIARLLAGTESKFGQRVEAGPGGGPAGEVPRG